jgi:hypothetical protein
MHGGEYLPRCTKNWSAGGVHNLRVDGFHDAQGIGTEYAA